MVVYTMFAATVYHSTIRLLGPQAGKVLLSFISSIIIIAFAPLVFILIPFYSLLFSKIKVIQKYITRKTLLVFLLILSILPLIVFRLFDYDKSFLIKVGLAFLTIKFVGLSFESYRKNKHFSVLSLYNYFSFYPLVTIGPIELFDSFENKLNDSKLTLGIVLNGCYLIVSGVFISHFLADGILLSFLSYFGDNEESIVALASPELLKYALLKALYSFCNFFAFCQVMMGLSYMFGVQVLSNFNNPLLSPNLEIFWRNYHISVGNFIQRYLYTPIAFSFPTKWMPCVAVFISFVIFGLWHEFTIKYFLWGIIHGFALAFFLYCRIFGIFKMLWFLENSLLSRTFLRIIGILATLSFFASVQTMANFSNSDLAIRFLKNLLVFDL